MQRFSCFTGLILVLLPLLESTSAFAAAGSRGRMGGSHWGANYFPNVRLTTHEGKTVRFFDDLLKDKVVVINFIYTSCPDVCPLETARLSQLQAILGDRVGRDVFMYSITIDPDTDTPEVLAEYAKSYGAGPGWLFLTGNEDDIILLRKKLGLYRPELQSDDSNDHNVSLIIGNQRTGRWMKRSPMEDPYFLANQVGGWLHNWKLASPNQSSYADAPDLRMLTTGENLFRTRCAACHVIGGRDQVPAYQNARLLGPDLLNVTQRREREWLARWLAAPDKMLAEKDPIAMELYGRHQKVAMPNFSLNDRDVNALLDFLETESRRVEKMEFVRGAVATSKANATGSKKASCCQKSKKLVLAAKDKSNDPNLPGIAQTSEEPNPARDKVSAAGLIVPGGLGCVFLLLAFVFGGGKPMSVKG